jgi:general secretion pathway protein G
MFPILLATLLILLGGMLGIFWHLKREQDRIAKAATDVLSLKSALGIYRIDNQGFPTTAQGLDALVRMPNLTPLSKNWRGPYWRGITIPVDPWGNSYIYRDYGTRDGGGWELFSAGPDGRPDTPDDLGH